MTYTQDLFSSRRNFADGNTRIGELDRIWYDPLTNTLRRSDGTTPGGIIIGFGGYIGSNVQIQSDWTQTDTNSVDYIKNKPPVFAGYTGSQGITGYVGSASTVIGYSGSQGPIGYTGSAVSNRPTRLVTTATDTPTLNDYYVGVNRAGPVTITLPTAVNGFELIIKDESGTCSTHNITIAGTIDNDAGGAVIALDNAALHFVYRSGWRIV